MKSINWETQADIVMERISIQEAAGRRFMLITAAAASFIIISLVSYIGFNYYQNSQGQYAKNNQNTSAIASVIGYYDVIDYSNIY